MTDRLSILVRYGSVALLVALLWLTLRHARADERPPATRLELAVARVAFNEAGASEPDLALIWAVVKAHGETSRERLYWLRAHSRCVAGAMSQDAAYQRPGRCRWTRNLARDGRRPRGWRRERDGAWSRTRPRWLAHLRRTTEHVRGERRLIVCPETPESWDGARWLDAIRERGWRPLDCKGTRNVGVAR